ncbi:TPA: hypothetical protein I7730_15910 [Vibrio vulnificus]|uniref:Uncharacterized protein n=1 Tax=Vibrio vulnificus TaxID=672 RepID=A0A8H9TGB2_VIBVL|nr:hypothetical protein [Vibrio vulnificus]
MHNKADNTCNPMQKVAADLNRSIERRFNRLEVGMIVMHPSGKKVKIKSGCFLDPTYGRVSNHWSWNEVHEDGSLGAEGSGYGWKILPKDIIHYPSK